MPSAPTSSVPATPWPSPLDSDALLASARELQRAGDGAPKAHLLRDRHLGLVCELDDGEEAKLFRRAATALGARVTHIRPSVSQLDTAGEDALKHTARILGRLYDGIECQGLDPSLVSRLARDAGVPVFDGLASSRNASAPLARLLDGADSSETKRLLILQAVLLFALLNRTPTGGLIPQKGTP